MAVILMDVDGPCAEFPKTLFDTMEAIGTKAPKVSDINTFHFFNTLLTPEQRTVAYNILQDPVFWENMQVVPGSQEAIASFQKAGHKVIYLTSPWDGCDGWEGARKRWLKRTYDANKRDVIPCPTEHKYRFGGDALVDDLTDTVKQWAAQHHKNRAYLFSCYHNRMDAWDRRIHWEHGHAEVILEAVGGL